MDELAKWLIDRWPHLVVSPSHIQQKAPRHLRVAAKAIRKRIDALLAAGILEHVGPAEIDGQSYREAYRIIRPAAEMGTAA